MKPHGRKWRGKEGWSAKGKDYDGGPWHHIMSGGYRKRMKV